MKHEEEKTKDLLYECIQCNKGEVVKSSDHRKDGRSCKSCGGHIVPKGYAVIGVDLSTSKDRTVYS